VEKAAVASVAQEFGHSIVQPMLQMNHCHQLQHPVCQQTTIQRLKFIRTMLYTLHIALVFLVTALTAFTFMWPRL